MVDALGLFEPFLNDMKEYYGADVAKDMTFLGEAYRKFFEYAKRGQMNSRDAHLAFRQKIEEIQKMYKAAGKLSEKYNMKKSAEYNKNIGDKIMEYEQKALKIMEEL